MAVAWYRTCHKLITGESDKWQTPREKPQYEELFNLLRGVALSHFVTFFKKLECAPVHSLAGLLLSSLLLSELPANAGSLTCAFASSVAERLFAMVCAQLLLASGQLRECAAGCIRAS